MKLRNIFRRETTSPAPEHTTPVNTPPSETTEPGEIKINNVDIIYSNRKGLRVAVSLFMYYKDHVDELNCIQLPKGDLATILEAHERTIKNWVKALSDAGIIKYKYSGTVRLNPEIYFTGTKENYEKALLEYERFKSDI